MSILTLQGVDSIRLRPSLSSKNVADDKTSLLFLAETVEAGLPG